VTVAADAEGPRFMSQREVSLTAIPGRDR